MADTPDRPDDSQPSPPNPVPGAPAWVPPQNDRGWPPSGWQNSAAQTGGYSGNYPPGYPGNNPPGYPGAHPGGYPNWVWAPRYGTSGAAVGAAIVLLIFAVITLLFGLLVTVGASVGYDMLVETDPSVMLLGEGIVTALWVMAVILIVLGVIGIAGAIGIFLHKAWGRWLGVVSAVIGILIGLFVLLIGLTPPVDGPTQVAGLIWSGAHVAAVIGLAVGGRHFQPQQG